MMCSLTTVYCLLLKIDMNNLCGGRVWALCFLFSLILMTKNACSPCSSNEEGLCQPCFSPIPALICLQGWFKNVCRTNLFNRGFRSWFCINDWGGLKRMNDHNASPRPLINTNFIRAKKRKRRRKNSERRKPKPKKKKRKKKKKKTPLYSETQWFNLWTKTTNLPQFQPKATTTFTLSL